MTNFEIQRYQNEPRFNGLYSRNYLHKIKDGVYVTNLSEYKSVGTYWKALDINASNMTYFDSFGFKYISKET